MTLPAAAEPRAAVSSTLAGSAMPAIQVDDVSMRYRVPQSRALSLKEYALARLRSAPRYFDHMALRNVSLTLHGGESLAVIGSNGSGKTTLLRLIARVLTPSSGRVRTHGRVAPLLDVIGAMHPELTGRENVFLNGTLLGLRRREIAGRFDRIVEFAELGPFIDAPVRTYSAGMMARLGFAVASDTDADILVVDEALGVGDERFQRKCAARIGMLRASGTAFVLVSHDMHSVLRLCARALWLDAGSIRASGAAEDVVRAFLEAQR